MKKILITGATGFIGQHLTLKLEKAGYQIKGISLEGGKIGKNKIIKLNLLKKKELDHFFKKNYFDIFIHLAARVPKSDNFQEQKLALRENILSTLNLLEAFKNSSAQRFIYASGITVMGAPKFIPVKETDLPLPESLYTTSKLLGEILCLQYHKQTGKKFVILRISAPYGPGQNPQAVIPFFIGNGLSSRDLPVYGSGNRAQDFIYISDVVEAFVASLKTRSQGIYNIASGQTTTTLKLAQMILKNLSQSQSKIVFAGRDPQEDYRLKVDITKARKELKFQPKVMIENGIKKYLNFFQGKNETGNYW